MSQDQQSSLKQKSSRSVTDTESFELKQKEGGFTAWLTVFGSVLIYYSSFGILNSFGFFQDYYTRDFLRSTPTAQIAFIGTLQMALMNTLAAVSGSLCDRYGIKYLYIGSGCGTITSLLILSCIRSRKFWQVFLVQGFLMGTSIAFGVQPALTVVGQHFKDRRALAMGVVSAGSALGGIGFPLMLEQLVPRVGFANALRLAALKIGACYTLALCISKSKPGKFQNMRGCSSLIDFRGFMDARYTVLCVGTFFAILGLWIPSYYIKTYANAVYPGNTLSEYFLCMMNGSSIIGAIFGGFMGDQLGRLNLLWPMALISGLLTLFLWLLSDSIIVLALFACLYGFSTSTVGSLPASIIGQITPDENLGARIGAFYSVVAVASLAGSPIGGALITDKKRKEGYEWLIFFSGVALIIGSMFMLGSRLLHGMNMRRRW